MAREIARRVMLGMAISAFAGLATVAVAQQGPGPGRGMMGNGMMGPGGGMMWNTGSYLDGLKGEIGITADQEPAWKDYAATVSGVSEQMRGLHQTMFDQMGSASWEQRRDLMNGMFEARRQAFDTVHEAAGKLVAALKPAQQQKARSMLPGLAAGPGMMGRGGPPLNRN